MRQEDVLHETVMIAMSEWCDEKMRCAHGVGLPFCVQYCNGMLAHEQYMFGENAYTGQSKDVRGSIANADLVINIIFGARRVS
jgi:hypothetical protein